MEHHEKFDASLALPDGTPFQVVLGRRDEAMVTILDEEIAEVHYDPASYEWDESVGTGYLNIVSNVTSTVNYSVNSVLSNGTAYGIYITKYTNRLMAMYWNSFKIVISVLQVV